MHYQVSFRAKAWYISSYVRNITFARETLTQRCYGYVINYTQNKQFNVKWFTIPLMLIC